jgi:hypothetical protein
MVIGVAAFSNGSALYAQPLAVATTPPPTAPLPMAEGSLIDDGGDTDDDESDDTEGYLRLDSSGGSVEVMLGATHSFGALALTSDVVMSSDGPRVDVGPSFEIGPVEVTPMVGVAFNFDEAKVTSLLPQLYMTLDVSRLYGESWWEVSWQAPFVNDPTVDLYTRNFLLWKFRDNVAAGPQMEVTYCARGAMEAPAELLSIPVGGRINLGYGEKNTLGVFFGYEAKAPPGSDGVAGRVTFIRDW